MSRDALQGACAGGLAGLPLRNGASQPRSLLWYTFPPLERSHMSTPPRWDMSNVYPSLESKEFNAAVADYKRQVAGLERFFDKQLAPLGTKTSAKQLAPLVGEAIKRINRILTLSGT